ncbi:MAG: transcriptional regulator [Lachnospiraceae bacterium]|nr:transcriptional regulator [Lachnospiraceae bacterium]
MAKQILNVKDVMQLLEVSESKSYDIIRTLNRELASKGYLTIPGKVSRAYFEEKLYGMHITE